MKKIIGALLSGVMLTGLAFAAEPDITMNYRSRMMGMQFKQSKTGDGDWGNKSVSWLNQSGYAGPEDAFGFKAMGENAGVQIQFNANATATGTGGGIGQLNTYNGWLKFGDLKISAGSWKDGYADGNYRVKKDVDGAALEGIDGEQAKLGAVFKKLNTTFIDNMAYFKGDGAGNLAFFAEYPIKATDTLTINILAGFVNGAYKVPAPDDDEKATHSLSSGPVARIQLNAKNILNTEIIWKNAQYKHHGIGVYFMPKMVKDLDLNIGGAIGLAPDNLGNDAVADKDASVALESWEVDLRLRYAISKKLSIYTFDQISGYTLNTGAENMRYNAGAEVQRVNLCPALNFTTKNAVMAMWNELGIRYVVSDLITVGGTVGVISCLKAPTDKQKKDLYDSQIEWRVTPYIQFYATKSSFVNIAFAFNGAKVVSTDGTEKVGFGLDIPIVIRARL